MSVDYAELIRAVRDAIIVAGRDGLILEMNPAAEEMLGWPAAELCGRPLTEIMPERYRAAHEAGLRRYLATRVPHLIGRTVEVEALRKDGSEVRVELALSGLQAEGGPQFAAVIRDLTKVERLTQAANEARERARRLDEEVRMRDQFLSAASHELRTPVSSLKMQLRLLERAGLSPEALPRLRRQAERLDRLVARMLDASRVGEGHLELAPVKADLVEVVREAVADFGVLAPSYPISVRAASGSIPIYADVDQLAQVLFNLLDNAVKYSPQSGPIEVDVWIEGGRARCRVVDRGMGIPAGLRDQLFMRFRRESSERVRSIPGLGVGLYISRAIVEAHGGHIGVTSEEGKGSAFAFELPAGEGHAEVEPNGNGRGPARPPVAGGVDGAVLTGARSRR